MAVNETNVALCSYKGEPSAKTALTSATNTLLLVCVYVNLFCGYGDTASPTPKVLSAQSIGAPVFKIRRWVNNQLTKYHSLLHRHRWCLLPGEYEFSALNLCSRSININLIYFISKFTEIRLNELQQVV